MRTLIVDVNYDYKNTMYRLFYHNLASTMEVDFFGPGYVSSKVLERGMKDFLEGKEAYDAILLGVYFLYSAMQKESGLRHSCYDIHRKLLPNYKINDAVKYCEGIFKEMMQIEHPVKIINYYEDVMSMPRGDYKVLRQLLENNFYILTLGKDFLEKYSLKSLNRYPILNNAAIELEERYHEKHISIPYTAIQESEMFFGDLSNREYDWCVPGNLQKTYYAGRQDMKDYLQEKNCKVWSNDPYQKLSVATIERGLINHYQFRNKKEKWISFIEKKNQYIASHPKLTSIAACRENYLESLRHSKCVYADGSVGKIMVRKYFEACANGAVLVCEGATGLEKMGFRDGCNMILADKNNILAIADRVEEDLEYFQNIANSGRELVIKKHTFRQRALNLRDSIEAIQKGTYAGSHWNNGDYILERRGKEA